MTEFKPITKSIQDTYCPNGVRIHIGETEDGDFQLHFYSNNELKIVKKCYHKNDAIQQRGQYMARYCVPDPVYEKEHTKRVGVYETVEFTPEGAFDPTEKMTLEKLKRVIETQVYTRKGKEVINYKNKVFQVHKNNVPMAIKADADYVFNLGTDRIDTKN